jgi:hypothetical protein
VYDSKPSTSSQYLQCPPIWSEYSAPQNFWLLIDGTPCLPSQ